MVFPPSFLVSEDECPDFSGLDLARSNCLLVELLLLLGGMAVVGLFVWVDPISLD
jgi:hypothetical protein